MTVLTVFNILLLFIYSSFKSARFCDEINLLKDQN